MSRYIDAEKINFKPIDIIVKGITRRTIERMATETEINAMPTADVQEVRHGVWKDVFEERVYALSRKYAHKRVCSICDKQANGYYSYCPNCGAKMCKEKEE